MEKEKFVAVTSSSKSNENVVVNDDRTIVNIEQLFNAVNYDTSIFEQLNTPETS